MLAFIRPVFIELSRKHISTAPASCTCSFCHDWIEQAAVELLKPTGGKVHAFLSSLPNTGSKALKMRDGNANIGDKEKQLGLLPQDNTYMTLAMQAADFNVSSACQDSLLVTQLLTVAMLQYRRTA
jgi:hypothetical protein